MSCSPTLRHFEILNSIVPVTDSYLLRPLGSILRPCLLTILNAQCIQYTANDVIANTRKVADAATPNDHNRVLLQIVSFATDIGGDLFAVRQPDTSNLTQCRVGLLRRHRLHLKTDTALERALVQHRCLRLVDLLAPRSAH